MQKGVDYPAVTVSYMCHDGQGNYLMNLRSQNCRDEKGTWDFGGGGLDFGDSVEKTLYKEIQEEYGVTPISHEFLGYLDIFREQNGAPTHWLGLNFLVLVDREKVINGEPHKFDDIGWFHLDALPTPLHSMMTTIVEKYKDKLPH